MENFLSPELTVSVCTLTPLRTKAMHMKFPKSLSLWAYTTPAAASEGSSPHTAEKISEDGGRVCLAECGAGLCPGGRHGGGAPGHSAEQAGCHSRRLGEGAGLQAAIRSA